LLAACSHYLHDKTYTIRRAFDMPLLHESCTRVYLLFYTGLADYVRFPGLHSIRYLHSLLASVRNLVLLVLRL